MCTKNVAILSLIALFSLVGSTNAQEAKEVTFSGRVVDSQGQPITGAKVTLYDEDYSEEIYSFEIANVIEATSNSNGEFSISWKTEGDDYLYGWIVVEKEGLALDCTVWDMSEDKECEFKLEQRKELAGVVVDEKGEPVVEAQVSVLILTVGDEKDSHGEHLHALSVNVAPKILNTTTDAKGKFTFTNIPADAKVDFLVQKAGRATISTFNTDTYRQEGLNFSPGQENIRITLLPESRIEGIVVDKAADKPVPGIKLTMRQGQNRQVYGQDVITSKEDGTFCISGLSAGSYNLMYASPRDSLAEWVARPVNVTLETGQTEKDVKIELGKGGLLEVLVTDAQTAKPLKEASIYFRHQSSSLSFSGRSNDKGIGQIRVLPGVYTSANVYKQDYSSLYRQETITIEEGSTKRLEWQLSLQPKVVGIVRDLDDKPVKAAKLSILPGGNRNMESNADGSFEVSWNPERFGGEERENPLLVCRDIEGNLANVVIISDGIKNVDVKLQPGITVIGKVVDPNGRGIEDAQIRMMLRQTMWASTFTERDSIKTEAEGNFEARAIPAEYGYNINVSADGYGGEEKDIHADDAVNNRIDIGTLTLPVANLAVSGVVVDIEGNPLVNARIRSYNFEGGQPDNLTTQTDSQGQFTLDGVCKGQINIRVNASMCNKQLSARVITDGGASDIKIVAREGRAVTQYIRKKNYDQIIESSEKVIAGVTVDENGSPVEGVPVSVCCKKTKRENGKFMWSFGGYENLSDTTDKQGRFVIELVEDAEYNLRFSPDNHAALIVYDVSVGKKDLKVVLPEGGTITGRLVRMEKGKKVPIENVQVKLEQEDRASYTHLGFNRDRTAITDSQGRFKFEHVRTKIRPRGSMSETQWSHIPRVWLLSYGDTSKSVAFYDGTTIDDIELLVIPDKQQTFTGGALPGFDGIKLNLAEEQAKGKMMLVCFFDYQQRPSRNCITQLIKRAQELQEKGFLIVAIQASKINENTLNEWLKNQNVPFPVGIIEKDEKETQLAWGVKSLPWLILTDKKQAVRAEGFSITELDRKIGELNNVAQ